MTSNSSSDSLSSPLWPAINAIDLYVTPVWYVLGVPGNILAFVVWVQRRMRPSSGCYLAALALDECLFLIMQVSLHRHSGVTKVAVTRGGSCMMVSTIFSSKKLKTIALSKVMTFLAVVSSPLPPLDVVYGIQCSF